ncbi:MAG: hypothetical protein NVS9B7_29220 [Flavisolibacter sp.]
MDTRGIILLSHHQYLSAFEHEYQAFANQLSSLLGTGRKILWFWGHEHRLAIYGKNKLPDQTEFFPRCIGNGGMPVEIKHAPKSRIASDPQNRNLVLYDNRTRLTLNEKIKIGYNGFVQLKFNDTLLNIEYYDNNLDSESQHLLTESWTINIISGQLEGVAITDHTILKEQKLTLFSSDIKNAIK